MLTWKAAASSLRLKIIGKNNCYCFLTLAKYLAHADPHERFREKDPNTLDG
jgi:hypothetical protein